MLSCQYLKKEESKQCSVEAVVMIFRSDYYYIYSCPNHIYDLLGDGMSKIILFSKETGEEIKNA